MKTIRIFQINNNAPYEFMGHNFAKSHGLSFKDYKLVYECTRNDIYSADDCFEEFNLAKPEDFRGHSLSVSDIIEIDNQRLYCDSVGWIII